MSFVSNLPISLQSDFERVSQDIDAGKDSVHDLAGLFEKIVALKHASSEIELDADRVQILDQCDQRLITLIQAIIAKRAYSEIASLFFSLCRAKDAQKIEVFFATSVTLSYSLIEKAVEIAIDLKDHTSLEKLLCYKVPVRVCMWMQCVEKCALEGQKQIVLKLLENSPVDDQNIDEMHCLKIAKIIHEQDYESFADWLEEESQESGRALFFALTLAVTFDDPQLVMRICALQTVAFDEASQSQLLFSALKSKSYSILGPLLTGNVLFSDTQLLKGMQEAMRLKDHIFLERLISTKPHLLQFSKSLVRNASFLERVAIIQPYVYFFANPEVSCYSKLSSLFHEYWMDDAEGVLVQPVVDSHGNLAADNPIDSCEYLKLISGIDASFGTAPLAGIGEKEALFIGKKIVACLHAEDIGGKYHPILLKAFITASSAAADKNRVLFADYKAGLPVVILTGSIDHYIAVVLYQGHMLIVNKAASIACQRVIYSEIDPDKVTQDVIDKMMLCVNAKSFQVTVVMLYRCLTKYLAIKPACSTAAAARKEAIERAFTQRIKPQKVGNCNAASWKKSFDLALFLLSFSDQELPKTVGEASAFSKHEADRLSCALRADACLTIMREGFTLALDKKQLKIEGQKVALYVAATFKRLKKKCRIITSASQLKELEIEQKE